MFLPTADKYLLIYSVDKDSGEAQRYFEVSLDGDGFKVEQLKDAPKEKPLLCFKYTDNSSRGLRLMFGDIPLAEYIGLCGSYDGPPGGLDFCFPEAIRDIDRINASITPCCQLLPACAPQSHASEQPLQAALGESLKHGSL